MGLGFQTLMTQQLNLSDTKVLQKIIENRKKQIRKWRCNKLLTYCWYQPANSDGAKPETDGVDHVVPLQDKTTQRQFTTEVPQVFKEKLSLVIFGILNHGTWMKLNFLDYSY